jgi:hypothetical protein
MAMMVVRQMGRAASLLPYRLEALMPGPLLASRQPPPTALTQQAAPPWLTMLRLRQRGMGMRPLLPGPPPPSCPSPMAEQSRAAQRRARTQTQTCCRRVGSVKCLPACLLGLPALLPLLAA